MKKQIATLCCLMLVQSAVVTAGEIMTASVSTQPVAPVVLQNGPLRRASRSEATAKQLSTEARWNAQQPVSPDDPDTRPWVERHPVWTGAMVGFAAGFVITYAAAGSDNDPDAIFKGIPPSGPALVFGGVAAGIGALAGWSIGRNQHDGYHNRSQILAPTKSR